MSETAEEQRTRILLNCDDNPADYDMALTLGYQPESWDGMYRLTREPFTYVNGYVVVREAAGKPGGTQMRVRCVKVPA